MAWLIDANKLKKEISSTFHGTLVTNVVHEIIDRQPTIDPESLRPRGKWARVKGDSGGQVGYRCSCCGSKWPIPIYVQFFVYCPYCGAKMEINNEESI